MKRISYDVFLCQGIALYLLKAKVSVNNNLSYAFFSIILSIIFGEFFIIFENLQSCNCYEIISSRKYSYPDS